MPLGTYDRIPGMDSGSNLTPAVRLAIRDSPEFAQFFPGSTTFYVELFSGTDAQKWQSAINAAVAFSNASVIQGGAKTYQFDAMVSVKGLQNSVVRGWGNDRTKITVKSGAGAMQHFFYNPVAGGGVITNLIFEDFSMDGGMTSAPIDLARSARVFGANKVDTPIRINGNLVPGETTAAVVNGVTARRVKVYGCEGLPLSFRGGKNIKVNDCDFERTMDVGFTWCDGVEVTQNRSLWSADNGFSISRGCTNIVVSENRVFGAWYWGIWLAGFDVNEGPYSFTCSANQIKYVGSGGITLDQGGRSGVISNNEISQVLRGGDGTSTYGLGIYLRGNPTATPTWCEEVVVVGNKISDVARGGILIRQYSRNILVIGNLVSRPGTNLNESGGVISTSDGYQNFGISVPAQTSEQTYFANIQLVNNLLIDDRATAYMNFGTFAAPELDATVVTRQGNRWFGARNGFSEIEPARNVMELTIGRNAASDAQLKINGASGATKAMVLQTAGNNRFALRLLSSDSQSLFFTSYTDGGTPTDAFRIDRDWHRLDILRPPKIPNYTTAARPSAVNFGSGSMIYDSTLKKPLWSDGTNWKDAASVTV